MVEVGEESKYKNIRVTSNSRFGRWGRRASKDMAPSLGHIRSRSTAAAPLGSMRNPPSSDRHCWASPAKAEIPSFPAPLTPSPWSVSSPQYSFPQG